MESLAIRHLEQQTRRQHAVSDSDRLTLMTSVVTPERYRTFLSRVFGFEAAVETALSMTPGLDEVVDLRSRVHLKLLKSDLAALGVSGTLQLPRCRNVLPFHGCAEALGWMYVVERNFLVHGILRRHLEKRLPAPLAMAGSYLVGNERAVGMRMRELGAVLDAVALTPWAADEVVVAAHTAFRCQHSWFAEAAPSRVRVA
jgi:heme oxygenase